MSDPNNMPKAVRVQNAIIEPSIEPSDYITLDYSERYKRRRVMESDQGISFLLDLPSPTELKAGDDFQLEDGRHIRIKAAEESLMKITASDPLNLLRIIWHIGNRHCPCAIQKDHILIQKDHVIAAMVEGLGGSVEPLMAPFMPEGGAYGMGRIHAHTHHV